MNFLLGTNVVSESMEAKAESGRDCLVDGCNEDSVNLSVLTLRPNCAMKWSALGPETWRRRLDDGLQKDLLQRFEDALLT